MKAWIGRILVTFAVFTLGYGLGKDVGLNRAVSTGDETAPAPQPGAGSNKVVVYYLHTTFRCVTCNTIERIAKETVENDLFALLESGKIEWHAINFQMNEALAKRYEVASSAVVIVKVEKGKETAFRRLDEAWTLYTQPEQLSALIVGVVTGYLEELEQ